jgi:hypothetical protein
VLFPFNVAQDSASLQHRSLSVPSSQILASLSHALLNHPLSSHKGRYNKLYLRILASLFLLTKRIFTPTSAEK